MKTRIKFCGITRVEDAEAAVQLGADAIGLVFAPDSPRFIGIEQAGIIRRRLPPAVQAVALFRNAAAAQVREVLAGVKPDLLQFHGEESAAFCAGFGLPYWRAVPMGETQDLADWARRFDKAAALLLDSHVKGQRGGLGKAFDWRAIPAGLGKPLVLAGGLNPDNAGEAVRQARPYAVDVSSGIESAPGIKDTDKMQRFIEQVRLADER
jgi:phosphoribosylanthranilate isomerase